MLPRNHNFNEPKLYTVDKNGMPKEEIKIIRDPIIAINPPAETYVTPPDFTFTGECTAEFSDQFREMLEETDRKILEEYTRMMYAVECCLQDRRECGRCPLRDDDSCRGHLLHNVEKVLVNHRELHRQMMMISDVEKDKKEK